MKNLNQLHYFEVPTVMKHGLGAVNISCRAGRPGCEKPLIVTDGGWSRPGFWIRSCNLREAGVTYEIYDEVVLT